MASRFFKLITIVTVVTLLVGIDIPQLWALENLEPGLELNRAENGDYYSSQPEPIVQSQMTKLLYAFFPAAAAPGNIGFTLATPQKIHLGIYDQQGKEVVQLAEDVLCKGIHMVPWDGCHQDGFPVDEATLFVLLQTSDSIIMRRMIRNP